MMPFIWPGGSLSEIRRGWSHSIRHNPRGVAPPKAEKWEASGKTLKESHWVAFSKDMEIIKAARWAYHPSHKGMFTQEGSYDLTLIFREMVQETNLLNVEIPEVQEAWTDRQELKATNCAAKASQREIQFSAQYHWVTQHHGVEGVSLPWGPTLVRLSLILPWCGKEGQNKGTMVNHLWNVHYCLGLICVLYWDFFVMSSDTMRWHASSCEALTTKDEAQEEEEESEGNNSNKDDRYLWEKSNCNSHTFLLSHVSVSALNNLIQYSCCKLTNSVLHLNEMSFLIVLHYI